MSAPPMQETVSPIDGEVCVVRPLAGDSDIDAVLERAAAAQVSWAATPLVQRAERCRAMIDAMVTRGQALAEELTLQMGRPMRDAPGEIAGLAQRAAHMIDIAPEALAAVRPAPTQGFDRHIEQVPLGVVLVVAPWNYPYLTSVNTIVPALVAGNTVVLKHSAQTPLCAERYAEAAAEAGLPAGVFQYVHCGHDGVAHMVGDRRVAFAAFTGSVAGGHAIQAAASKRFIGTGLELGGKDPAYVRADADVAGAVAGLVDGAFYNAGQSCCGVERIYVHRRLHDEFIHAYAQAVRAYRLGDPRQAETTLGPMVRASGADYVREQIGQAVACGARALIDEADYPMSRADTPYLAPQVLVGVDHEMNVMREESFGPVVGIMAVSDDEDALACMNDSDYGLTASIWTTDVEAAHALGGRLETGTVFMNRCDYLDPALAWTGVKDSGRGCTLSALGYQYLTRPKSFHFKR